MSSLRALVTLLNVLLLLALTTRVGQARGKFGIMAPATSGHPVFERHMRVHMNTLESTVMFLPTLWVAAHYANAMWAGVLGLVWIVARVWYALAYAQDPARRGRPFGLAALAFMALLLMAAIGVARALLAGA